MAVPLPPHNKMSGINLRHATGFPAPTDTNTHIHTSQNSKSGFGQFLGKKTAS